MSAALSSRIKGVLPVFSTPFHDDETIDFETLEKEIDWIYSQGSDGVVMGMVSETLRLSCQEREQLAEAVCRFNRDRGVVIISAGAESTHTALHFARHAESVGAHAVMVTPPITMASSEDEIKGYYERIIQAIKIPIVVQDSSGYIGHPMSIDLQANLFNKYSEQIIFKPEAVPIGPRLSALRDATGGRAPILEGTGGIALVDSYRRGIAGTMPGADIIDALVALWRALEHDDTERTYQLSLAISSIIAVQNSLDAFVAVEKYLLVKRGIFKNSVVRGPVGYTIDEETRREIDRLFELLIAMLKT